MRVLERAVYRGPHLYSATPMVRIQLDLGALEEWPTDRFPASPTAWSQTARAAPAWLLATAEPGGLLSGWLDEGTWLGHVAEHVALELQTPGGRAGDARQDPVGPGPPRRLQRHVRLSTRRPSGCWRAGWRCELVDSLLPPELRGVQGLDRLMPTEKSAARPPFDIAVRHGRTDAAGSPHRTRPDDALPGARRRSAAAFRSMRLDEHEPGAARLGSRQERLRASDHRPHLAPRGGGRRRQGLTKALLAERGLPVPRGAVVRTADEAVAAAAADQRPGRDQAAGRQPRPRRQPRAGRPRNRSLGFEQAAPHSRHVHRRGAVPRGATTASSSSTARWSRSAERVPAAGGRRRRSARWPT